MSEKYPIHIMIKPEGLVLFPDYLASQIQLLEIAYGGGNLRRLRTILTPEEVDLIYPNGEAPAALKESLTKKPTEHYFFTGDASIYGEAKKMKGKYGSPTGVRGVLPGKVRDLGVRMERWENFLHSSDTALETQPVCSHFNTDRGTCADCVAGGLCYSK